ncbi:MAG: hypothetical protein IKK43_06570 [Clostridia bacterium]|nr:hypothetical protein [Clostridia bacterium]
MKIVKDTVAYVEVRDILFLGSVPRYIADNLQEAYSSGDYIEQFKDEKSVTFWRENDTIIDYGIVSSLSDLEISDMIFKLKNKANTLAKRCLNLPLEWRRNISQNDIKNIEYQIKTLEGYIANRNEYEQRFKGLF